MHLKLKLVHSLMTASDVNTYQTIVRLLENINEWWNYIYNFENLTKKNKSRLWSAFYTVINITIKYSWQYYYYIIIDYVEKRGPKCGRDHQKLRKARCIEWAWKISESIWYFSCLFKNWDYFEKKDTIITLITKMLINLYHFSSTYFLIVYAIYITVWIKSSIFYGILISWYRINIFFGIIFIDSLERT